MTTAQELRPNDVFIDCYGNRLVTTSIPSSEIDDIPNGVSILVRSEGSNFAWRETFYKEETIKLAAPPPEEQ